MPPSAEWKVAVVGASGELGRRIVETLAFEPNIQIVATSRNIDRLPAFEAFPNVSKRELDLEQAENAARILRDCEAIVFCPILTLSLPTAQAMRARGSDARFVLFSSNNVGLDEDAVIYQKLRSCEEAVQEMKLPWALVRPTMIYGAPGDGNLGRLMALSRKYPVLPMPGDGTAQQRPIHYDDLAGLAACLILDMDWRRLEVGAAGPEAVTLHELYDWVAAFAPGNCWVVSLPLDLLAAPIRWLEKLGLRLPISSAQLDRVKTDKLPTWPIWEGWEPEIGLEEGLSDLAAQFEEQSEQ